MKIIHLNGGDNTEVEKTLEPDQSVLYENLTSDKSGEEDGDVEELNRDHPSMLRKLTWSGHQHGLAESY